METQCAGTTPTVETNCTVLEQEHESTLKDPDIDEVVDELRRLVPGDWTAGTLVCLFKGKGSRSDPAAYRGISLLSSVEKIAPPGGRAYITEPGRVQTQEKLS